MAAAARIFAFALTFAGLAACAHSPWGPREGLRRIAGPAGTLVVDDGGRGGVPVVFVHSYAGSKAHWSEPLAHLRRNGRRAIAFDVRGHGQSSPPAGNVYAVEALAADIGAVVDALAFDRFVLVGHSMGSSAAIAYAGAHPQRVAGLLLLGAPAEVPPEHARKIVASIEADYDRMMQSFWNELLTGARPDVRARLMREKDSVGKEASLAIIRALFTDDPVQRMRRYSGPVMIVTTSREDNAYDLHKVMPQLPSTMIAGTSHWPHLDKPDAFERVLDAFLITLP